MLDIGKSRVIAPRSGEHRKFDGFAERNLKFEAVSRNTFILYLIRIDTMINWPQIYHGRIHLQGP